MNKQQQKECQNEDLYKASGVAGRGSFPFYILVGYVEFRAIPLLTNA